MSTQHTIQAPGLDEVIKMVATDIGVDSRKVLAFTDANRFVEEVIRHYYRPGCTLVSAGHVTPEIEMAADRAEIELIESIPSSPFCSNVETVLANIRKPWDIVYVANPNRVTGANFSLAHLQELAQAVPRGAVIVDEYFHEYFGISALPLTDLFTNVIVLRSFTASFGVYSSDAGYAVCSRGTAGTFQSTFGFGRLSPTLVKTLHAVIVNKEALATRLKMIHNESLRIVTALNELGVRSRITATDSLLLFVERPKDVANFLARNRIRIRNLDGYPRLERYMSYRIESELNNDRLIEAFRRMPAEYYLTSMGDRRRITLRRGEERAAEDSVADLLCEETVSRVNLKEYSR